MLAEDPDVFFTTPHFDGFPAVLVRPDRIGPEDLDSDSRRLPLAAVREQLERRARPGATPASSARRR